MPTSIVEPTNIVVSLRKFIMPPISKTLFMQQHSDIAMSCHGYTACIGIMWTSTPEILCRKTQGFKFPLFED